MKKLLFVAVFFLFAAPAFATISQVQSNANWSCSGTSCAQPFTLKPAAGHLVAVWTFWQSTSTVTASAADGLCPPTCNVYSSAAGPTLQSSSMPAPTTAQVFYAKNYQNPNNVPVTVTVTFSGSVSTAGMVIVEYSGLDQDNPLDSVSSAFSSSQSNFLDSGNVAPANSNLLVFGGGFVDNGSGLSAGSGFSSIQSNAVSGNYSAITEQNTSAITGNNALQRATACLGPGSGTNPCSSNTGNWLMQMAIFRATNAGAVPTVQSGWSPVRTGVVRYCDRYPDLPTCVADVDQSGGGVAVVNKPFTLTSPLTVGDQNGTPITLRIESGGQIYDNVNNSGGASCPGGPSGQSAVNASMCFGPGSGLDCVQNYSLTAQSSRVPGVILGTGLSVQYVITNLVKSGLGQNMVHVAGCYIHTRTTKWHNRWYRVPSSSLKE
jgi:hypothetical protein